MKGKELPDALYHVVGPEWEPGQPLQSLYRQHKDAAYDIYSERWPDAGDLSQYHPHYTMFYDKLEDARQHPGEGRILKIDPAKVDLRFDQLEPPGYWITSEDVPPDAITVTPHKAGE